MFSRSMSAHMGLPCFPNRPCLQRTISLSPTDRKHTFSPGTAGPAAENKQKELSTSCWLIGLILEARAENSLRLFFQIPAPDHCALIRLIMPPAMPRYLLSVR